MNNENDTIQYNIRITQNVLKMKKSIFLGLTLLTITATKAFAYDFQVDNLCYTILSPDDKTVSVEAAEEKPTGDVVIPSTVSYNGVDFKVIRIADNGFEKCYYITTLTIPYTMTHIGYLGLGWMQGLETLVFDNPQNMTIGSYAFNYDWRSFSKVKIINCDERSLLNQGLNLVTSLPLHELYINDQRVEDYVVPEGTEIIGPLFSNCNTLRTLELPNTVKKISSNAASGCNSLTTVTLSSSLESIDYNAFADCSELRTIYLKAATPPLLDKSSFANGCYMFATLYVPKGTLSDYKNAEVWKDFVNIEEKEYSDAPVEPKSKCSTPVIYYEKGKISFSCETEGAEFVSEISSTDIGTYTASEINVAAVYNISVYAKANGYENSETATATLCWIDADPETEGISNGIAKVRANPVLIQSYGNVISVSGAEIGSPISVFDVSGKEVGSATVSSETTYINTNPTRGQIGIIKIGEKSVKFIMK